MNQLVLKLPDGQKIPQLGFGTLSLQPDRNDTPENAQITANIVSLALQHGYRHIDTAQLYGNERGVGDAVRSAALPREELFLTSKLANQFHAPDDVKRSFVASLEKIGVDQLDLFLIHWPLPTLYDGDYVSTWKALLELQDEGVLRNAGVSNFQPLHLDRIIQSTGRAPAVNQIEIHPYFANREAIAACRQHGVCVEAWSPLGQGKVLTDPIMAAVALEHGKSAAQVVLRWHLQHGHIVIPKSATPQRIKENLQVFDFELTPANMQAIDSLDRGDSGRIGPNPDTFAWIPSESQPVPSSPKP